MYWYLESVAIAYAEGTAL